MQKLISELSVFFPAYNEEASIKNTVEAAKKVLLTIADTWEIIVVNDGSSDRTGEITGKLSENDERIRVINHVPNAGYGAALKSGFYSSKYSWIAFTDSDGQFDFSEVTNFIRKQRETGADLVIGYYKKRRVSFFKIVTSRLWEFVVFLLFGLKARDIDCGFKFISKKVIDSIPKLESERGAFVSSEFLIKTKKAGFKIEEIPVTHLPRRVGEGTGRDLNVIIRSFIDLLRLWGKLHREAIILGVILLVGAFLRLYRISEYMTFLGDEGRDVIIVRRLLVYLDPILIGPGTSIGNMYLGPLYYYMMAPALALAGLSPVGPAVQIAFLGVATTFFIWYIARIWFGKTAGVISALFYALAPTVIIYSRSSWNPNIMPFFALLSIWGTWKFWQEGKWKWLIIVGIALAFTLQSHYLALLLFPVIGFFWLLTYLKVKKTADGKKFLLNSVFAGIIFLFLMSPLVIFDARHSWKNFAAMRTFFTVRQTTVSARPWKAIPKIPKLAQDITTRLVAGRDETAGKITFLTIIALSIFLFAKRNSLNSKKRDAFALLSVWFAFALIGLGLYKQEIYDHYYGFFFSAPFLLLGGISQYIVQSTKNIGKIALFLVLSLLFFVNLQNSPLKYPPNRQLQRSIEVAKKIEQEAGKEKFNLAVIAERNYEDGYQYFLEKMEAPVVDIDAQRPETITGQLFVVCEMPKDKCQPTTNPKAEVANFGWSKIAGEWEVFGVTVYKLVHTK